MKSKLILLVGPPLSGKDTYLQSKDFTDYIIISRDDILMKLHKNDNYSQAFNEVDHKLVDKKLNDMIGSAIQAKENVIINMTNLSKKSRQKHISKFPKDDYEKIAIVFPKLDISEYINRNLQRQEEQNKFIPINVIESMLQSWQETTPDEGFDKIIKL